MNGAGELSHTLHMISAGVHCLFVSLADVPTILPPAESEGTSGSYPYQHVVLRVFGILALW